MSMTDLATLQSSIRDELITLRYRQVAGQLTDTSRLRILRRDIARMETISKELLANPRVEVANEKPKEKPKTKAKPKAEPKEKPEEKPKVKAKPKAKAKVKAETEEGEA